MPDQTTEDEQKGISLFVHLLINSFNKICLKFVLLEKYDQIINVLWIFYNIYCNSYK